MLAEAVAFCLLVATSEGQDAKPPSWVAAPLGDGAPAERAYPLAPTSDGGFVHDDMRFVARVAPDGAVRFDDKHASLRFGLLEPDRSSRAGAGAAPPTWTETARRLLDPRYAQQTSAAPAPTVTAETLRPWPSEVCRDPRRGCHGASGPVVASMHGGFDLTDELMRALGQDPYRHEKAKFLAATFDVRMTLARDAQRRDLNRALADLPVWLARLWADRRYTPPEKRRLLVHLWTELATNEDGLRAAAVIESFIRRQLPPHDPHAFTPRELDDYARLGGPRPFVPYRR